MRKGLLCTNLWRQKRLRCSQGAEPGPWYGQWVLSCYSRSKGVEILWWFWTICRAVCNVGEEMKATIGLMRLSGGEMIFLSGFNHKLTTLNTLPNASTKFREIKVYFFTIVVINKSHDFFVVSRSIPNDNRIASSSWIFASSTTYASSMMISMNFQMVYPEKIRKLNALENVCVCVTFNSKRAE
jgi:hypothetical protein